jgi:hypothetical protein
MKFTDEIVAMSSALASAWGGGGLMVVIYHFDGFWLSYGSLRNLGFFAAPFCI